MLVNAYSKRVFNLAYQFAGSYHEAEDLTQDIFFKLYNSLDRYDFERSFAAWLLTLARNHLIDTYRRTKWEKTSRDAFEDHLLAAGPGSSPEAGLDAEANRRLVWGGLNSLSAEIRLAVVFRDIQDKTYEEISQILSLPIGTVKSRVSRGRLQLAKILRERKEAGHEM